jgi:F-type H+-transporting ATPase subunit a
MLAILEIISLISKCVALMIRLVANMLAGHSLLAVFLMFILVAIDGNLKSLAYVGPLSVLGSVFVSLIELLVAALQAYIFTFLSAIFMGLYMEPAH